MSQTIAVTLSGMSSEAVMEAIHGLLYPLGYEGTEEGEDFLRVYFNEKALAAARDALDDIAKRFGVRLSEEVVPDRNWNAEWESSFQPVVIDGWAGIRASFHAPATGLEHDIVIDPKMSFGTGHHATTAQMIALMRHIPFTGSEVLDLGSGTGVLAILAYRLGAQAVTAIDNDPLCRDNAEENCRLNGTTEVQVMQGELEDAPGSYDIILANIQRTYLLGHMAGMDERLRPGGYLFMSGFFENETILLLDAALEQGLIAHYLSGRDNWAAVIAHKWKL